MTDEQNEIDQPDIDDYSTDEDAEQGIDHHPDLIDAFDRYDYIAVDGQTLVGEFKFADGTGLKAWTRDQGKAYTTRRLDANGRALLSTTAKNLTPEQVNDQVESIAAEQQEAE